MKKKIVLIATLDTKGKESLYLKNIIEKEHQLISVDMGTGARGSLVYPPEFTNEDVVTAAGSNMDEIRSLGDTGQENKIMDIMTEGTTTICHELYGSGRMDGIISVGGTMGTNLGAKVMRALPFGLPKVMLSTVASGDVRQYVGTKDIVMIPSIADIAGLNRITETTLTYTAGAIMGMVGVDKVKSSDRPVIGITTLGGTTNCALEAKKLLEEKNFEVVIFHANGMGGKAMEEMIEEGIIQGVLDISTNEIVDHMYQGWSDAGPTRLLAAGKKGIPQVIAPGNIDHIIYSSLDKIPAQFKDQYVHIHAPGINVLRTKEKEMVEVAEFMADRIKQAKGKTAIIFPTKGLSILDQVDKEFDDIEANFAWFNTIKGLLNGGMAIREIDVHVTETAFGVAAADMLYEMMQN
ncbi:conserved hypothetical protein [Desulfosarcina cetonica]|uniref:Tm-1-like ATP-binding domain-containing protein n=1 Tax=Desulfosarcina cetonica TaxID=90730 RepID=UPI0006D2587E|nr:Tm-1-like ATP-binding domain-containing protein [Desulfosarcina cetonica]VTR67879.1 conserved hypothetical protein [Desulfosarcina cetonica]